MNEEQKLEFLRQIVKINSVSGNESEISKYLSTFLKDHGFTMIPSKIGNVIGMKGQGNPILLLASHMDTVKTTNPFREDQSSIYGTGVVDCKGSLAAMFIAGATASWPNDQGTLIIAGIVHEEDDLVGIEELFSLLPVVPNYAVFGEPTEDDRICIGYRGRIWLNLTVSGEKGHTACAWEFENTIEIAYQVYQKIQQYVNDYNQNNFKKDYHFHELSVNISAIHAGDEANSLPEKCICTIDIRIPPALKTTNVIKEIEELIVKFQSIHSFKKNIQIKSSVVCQYDACDVSSDHPVVNALRWSAFQIKKTKIILIRKTGSTFTNLINSFYSSKNPQFACITYGPGNSHLEHTNFELIIKRAYLDSIQIYYKFFSKIQEMYRNSQTTKEL